MSTLTNRVVTYLNDKYKKKIEAVCEDREEKEATILREIIKDYFDQRENNRTKKTRPILRTTSAL